MSMDPSGSGRLEQIEAMLDQLLQQNVAIAEVLDELRHLGVERLDQLEQAGRERLDKIEAKLDLLLEE